MFLKCLRQTTVGHCCQIHENHAVKADRESNSKIVVLRLSRESALFDGLNFSNTVLMRYNNDNNNDYNDDDNNNNNSSV